MFQNVSPNILCFYVIKPTWTHISIHCFLSITFPANLDFSWKSGCPLKFAQDVFLQTSPNLPQIYLRHHILQTYWAKFSLTEKYQSFEELIFSWNELVAIATLTTETRFHLIGLKCFLNRSMMLKTSSIGCILCCKFEGAKEGLKMIVFVFVTY